MLSFLKILKLICKTDLPVGCSMFNVCSEKSSSTQQNNQNNNQQPYSAGVVSCFAP